MVQKWQYSTILVAKNWNKSLFQASHGMLPSQQDRGAVWLTMMTLPLVAKQLKDVGLGLQFLHTRDPPVAHGSLRPQNVLITDSGQAALGDYGILPLLAMVDPIYTTRLQPGVLVDMDERNAWLKVDLASFGTLILEVRHPSL